MQSLSVFMQSAGLFSAGNLWVLFGIVAAACVLGVEVACIGILIKKMQAAKRNQAIREEEEQQGGYDQFAMLAVSMAAIPFSAETVLIALTVLVALAAVLFLVLLIIFRTCGYDLASAEMVRAEEQKRAEALAYTPVIQETDKPVAPQREDEPLALPEEDEEADAQPVVTDEQTEIVLSDETPIEEGEERLNEQADSEPAAIAAFAPDPAEPVVGAIAPVAQPVSGTNGATPVRIVQIEKEYTETVREVQNPPATSDSSDEILEKLNTIIDKMGQQTAAPAATDAAHPAAETTVIVNGSNEPIVEEEDEDEDEDDELEDASADAKGDDEDDIDDEPDDKEHFTGNERIIGFDEATGCYIVAHYRKSFEAKLIQSRPNIKNYYSEIKNALLAYKGTKSRVSWNADSFHNGRTSIAKINVKTRILELYLAIEPTSLEGTVYRGRDVSHLKKYADTPFQYKIRTPRKFKWAMELVQRVCEEHGLSPIDIEKVDYESAYPFEDTDSLVARGLIKEYIREEKPASTFELDDTHVPQVADVDETVIPANANISWEFDNEVLAQKEPEPVPEPEPIQEPEPEPAPTPKAEEQKTETAAGGTYIRETTKVTQVKYTEQYFGDPGAQQPTYTQYLSNEDPFTAEFVESTPAGESRAQERAEEEIVASQTEEISTDISEETIDAEVIEDAESDESDTPVEEPVAAEPEAESGLLSEFEKTSDEPDADDLDWGIPASLTVSVPVAEEKIAEEEPVEEIAEEQVEEVYEDTEAIEEAYEESEEVYEEAEEFYEEPEAVYEESEETYEEPETIYEEAEAYYEETEEGVEYYGEEEYSEAYYDEEASEESYEGVYEEDCEEVVEEEPAEPQKTQVNPDIALVDVSVLETNFPMGAEIDLAALKAKGLVLPTAKTLKIYATGSLSKAFTVVADQFTMDAIIAISGAGGEPQMIRR